MSAVLRFDLYLEADVEAIARDIEEVDPGINALLRRLANGPPDASEREQDDLFNTAYPRCLRALVTHPIVRDRQERDQFGGPDAAYRMLVYFHMDPNRKALWNRAKAK